MLSASVGLMIAKGCRSRSQPFPCVHLAGHPEHSSVPADHSEQVSGRALCAASPGPAPRVAAAPLALLAQVLGQVEEEEAQLALQQLPVGEEDAGDVGLFHSA